MSKPGGRGLGVVLSVLLVGGALAFLLTLLGLTRGMGFEYTMVGLLGAGLTFGFVLLGPLGKAIGELLSGGGGDDGVLAMRVADLEDRLQEVSLETQRFLEIEDRLEFAERMLAARDDTIHRGEA